MLTISRCGWRPWHGQIEDHCSRGNKPNAGAKLWLEGFLGFEPRMVIFKVNNGLIAEKFSCHTWVECGPCPVFASYTLALALQLRKKHAKTSVRVVENCQLGTIQCINMAAFCGWPGQIVDPDFPVLGEPDQCSVCITTRVNTEQCTWIAWLVWMMPVFLLL
jgi:hypothetical protein